MQGALEMIFDLMASTPILDLALELAAHVRHCGVGGPEREYPLIQQGLPDHNRFAGLDRRRDDAWAPCPPC